jgi:tetratricopeptide (TPR) repeat protein
MRWLAVLVCSSLLLAQRKPLEEAWDLLIHGRRPDAVRLLRKLIADNPGDGEAHLMLGSVLEEDGARAEAIAELNEAARLLPKSVDAQYGLGEAYNKFGDHKAAREPLLKAVALDPNFAPARVDLGLVFVEASDFETAAVHLDRALELLGRTPDAAYPHYLRAKVCTAHSEVDGAVAHLTEAVALRPDFAEAWSDLGEARKALGDDPGAVKALERAVALAPEDAVAQTRLGAQYLEQGDAHSATAHLQQATRLDPQNQSTLYSLQRALREDGQDAQADTVKAKLAQLLRDKDRADQRMLSAIQLNNQGVDLDQAGKLAAALEKYRAALALLPDHTGIRINVAIAQWNLGNWDAGLAELREAVRRDPENAAGKAALAEATAQNPRKKLAGGVKF